MLYRHTFKVAISALIFSQSQSVTIQAPVRATPIISVEHREEQENVFLTKAHDRQQQLGALNNL